jgi:hypothetical protein
VQKDQPSGDADVIVPPTPTTRTLPEAETEGVTSGAVVPPGSTGALHDVHSRSSTVPSNASTDGDESDFTDDDIDDLADDDPDELILINGGAGIPIGPVRQHHYLSLLLPELLYRTAYLDLSYLPLHPNTLVGSVSSSTWMRRLSIVVLRFFFFFQFIPIGFSPSC